MAKTKHIQKRMSQRSIKNEMLSLVAKYGVKHGDKRVLNRKACDSLLAEINSIKKHVAKAKERGGYILVEEDEKWITAYALDSYSRKLKIH